MKTLNSMARHAFLVAIYIFLASLIVTSFARLTWASEIEFEGNITNISEE